jgi:hypothetical protein
MEFEVGRIIRCSTERFAVGCQVLQPHVPLFGSLVKVRTSGDHELYGLIHDVRIEDDLLVRQIAVAGEELGAEYIEHMRRNRQIPIEVGVLVVGYRRGNDLFHHLPPQPPPSLDIIRTCSSDELVAFTARLDYFRLVLCCRDLPADELLAANLRYAAQARNDAAYQFLVEAGRELARLLVLDLPRLDGILRRIQP